MEKANSQEPAEFWMRGPIKEVPALLQPVAHALLQMEQEFCQCLDTLEAHEVWMRPKNVASVGFHVLHSIGVIDRMFTYAANEALTELQFAYLKSETQKQDEVTVNVLKKNLKDAIDMAVLKLKAVDVNQLTEIRYLGRKKIEVTLIGLLFHAAEHSMRHLGQALVTAKMLK